MAALAGLLDDGSVYLAGDDSLWHWIPDAETFNAMGLDWGSVTWYGDLPGTIGDPLSSLAGVSAAPAAQPPSTATPFAAQPTPVEQPPPPRSGIRGTARLFDGSLYVAVESDWYWHPIDPETFAALGLDVGTAPLYGELPGTVGERFPSLVGGRTGAQLMPQQPVPAGQAPSSSYGGPVTGATTR